MHTWHWQTWQGRSYLTCSLLKDWSHGFFTQQFWSQPPETLVHILQPNAQVYRVKQVHGNTVLSAAEVTPIQSGAPESALSEEQLGFAHADGLLSAAPDQAVWVCTADCTPVLIGDTASGQVAAVHAGWRGTAATIVPQAIARLQAQGSRLKDLRVALGPAIAGEVYQVSTAVAAQVGATVVKGREPEPETVSDDPTVLDAEATEAILDALRQLPDSPVLPDPQPKRVRLDVRRVNQLQLHQLGIEPDQIAIAPYCTYQNPELFFSYRREHQKKVQWSGIVSAAA